MKPLTRIGPYEMLVRLAPESSPSLFIARDTRDPCRGPFVAEVLPSGSPPRIEVDLDHPGLAALVERATIEGREVSITEHVAGVTAEALLRAEAAAKRTLSARARHTICAAIGGALIHLHDRGFVHGAVRLHHIFVGFDGTVKLGGFGALRESRARRDREEDLRDLIAFAELDRSCRSARALLDALAPRFLDRLLRAELRAIFGHRIEECASELRAVTEGRENLARLAELLGGALTDDDDLPTEPDTSAGEAPTDQVPMVFISYSHTSREHMVWVKQLAKALIARGVQVVLDQFDLRPGQDINLFMERGLHSARISKVLIVSDARYRDCANGRRRGGGVEALILAEQAYHRLEENRLIPIVCEWDDDDRPCLPRFLESRHFIDLSTDDPQQFEVLVRAVHGLGIETRPDLGRP